VPGLGHVKAQQMAKMEMPHNNIVTKMDSACFVSIKLNFTDSFLQPILAIAHWII